MPLSCLKRLAFLKPVSLITLCVTLMTACTTLPPQLPSAQLNPLVTAIPNVAPMPHSFALTGKIGIHTAKQSGSAFYTWTQQLDHYQIDVSGALGMGHTTIDGDAQQVNLQSSKTGYLTAQSPEDLLEKTTGWRAPLSQVGYWVMGLTQTPQASAKRDVMGRLTEVTDQDWHIVFYYNNQELRPNKLLMTQADNRIMLTIQTRNEIPLTH